MESLRGERLWSRGILFLMSFVMAVCLFFLLSGEKRASAAVQTMPSNTPGTAIVPSCSNGKTISSNSIMLKKKRVAFSTSGLTNVFGNGIYFTNLKYIMIGKGPIRIYLDDEMVYEVANTYTSIIMPGQSIYGVSVAGLKASETYCFKKAAKCTIDVSETGPFLAQPIVTPTQGYAYYFYTVKNYTIEYDKNGGGGSCASSQTFYAMQNDFLDNSMNRIAIDDGSNLKKTGYAFAGWYTDPTSGEEIISLQNLAEMKKRNLTVYAHWTKEAMQIKYESGASDAYGSVVASALPDSGFAVVRRNMFVRPGYVFTGWTISPSIKEAASDGQTLTERTTVKAGEYLDGEAYARANFPEGELLAGGGNGIEAIFKKLKSERNITLTAGWSTDPNQAASDYEEDEDDEESKTDSKKGDGPAEGEDVDDGSSGKRGKDGSGTEGQDSKDGSGKDGSGKDGSGKDGSDGDGSGKDGSEKDGSGKDGSGKDGSGEDGSGKDGSGKDGSGKDGSGKDGSGKDGSGKDGSGKDGSGKDGSDGDGSGKDGSGKEGSGKDSSGKEGSGKDSGDGIWDDGTGVNPDSGIAIVDPGQLAEADNMTVSFDSLLAFSAKQTKHRATITWSKVKGADGYIIYGNMCNLKKHEYPLVCVQVLEGRNHGKWTAKGLKKATAFKFQVCAYKLVDGVKQIISKAPVLHVMTKGGKYEASSELLITSVGGIDTSESNDIAISLKKGEKVVIKAEEGAVEKKLMSHRDIIYVSGDKTVARVNKQGTITAMAAGTCTVYVYAQNGVYKTVKLTIE